MAGSANDESQIRRRVLYRGATIISEQVHGHYGRPILIKEFANARPPSHEIDALLAEHELSCRLSCGSVRAVLGKELRNDLPALLLEPVEGITIREYLRTNRLEFAERLRLTRDLARAVLEIHAAKVVHNDLTDTNVLVSTRDRSVVIIDLGSAAWRDGGGSVARVVQPKTDSLSYLAPERMQGLPWDLDYRSDTYSLGVMVYQILTGELPFHAQDPHGLLHEHAARQPAPPSRIAPGVPRMLDRIVLKLLAKDRADRYQSAFGLLTDLQECVDQHAQRGAIRPFAPGSADRCSQLRIPDTLYGRDGQREQLRKLILEDPGDGPRLVLVSGYAGIGKTALVRDMQGPILEAGGVFIQGKAEQYRSGVPHTVVSTAFGDLLASVLSKSDRELRRWSRAISMALGDGARALAAVVPGLDRLVDVSKEVPFLGGQEARSRLDYVVRKLFQALTGLCRPTVVFLDDLQWIDSASLRLLRAVVSDRTLNGLCVVGAYRDNEVAAQHRLSAELKELKRLGIRAETIVLDNLELSELSTMLQGALGRAPEIDALTAVLFEKTLGNPFFVRHLLQALADTEQIRFDIETQEWKWDIEALEALEVSENVVDYLASTVRTFDSRTQGLLKLAACAGTRFDPEDLASVRGERVEDVVTALSSPRTARLLHRDEGLYRFIHDRIHQAIHEMSENSDKLQCHLQIGRRLAQITPEEQLDERIFEIVDHLNAAAPLLVDQRERCKLANLNLRAARRSRDSAAFPAMLGYLDQGVALLAADSWRTDYRLTLDLHTMMVEAEYFNTNFEKALERAESVFGNAHSILDRVQAYELAMACCCATWRMREALDMGCQVLDLLGRPLLRSPPPPVEVQTCRVLPRMSNPEGLAAMRILTFMFPAAMIAQPDLCPPVVFSLIDQSVTLGACDYSVFACALYGNLLCQDPEQVPRAYQFGRLALELLEAGGSGKLRNRARELLDAFVGSWPPRHLREVMADMRRLVQTALQSGDVSIACNQLMSLSALLHWTGEPLDSARLQLAEDIRSIAELRQGFQLKIAKAWAQLQLTLGGLTGDPTRLIGEYFDEDRTLAELKNEPSLTRYYVYLAVAIHRFFTREYEQCLRYIRLAAEQRQQLFGFPIEILHAFYHALAMLQLYPTAGKDKRAEYRQALEPIRRKLRALANQDSINFQPSCYLVEAETARVLENFSHALRCYDRAISAAKANGFPSWEALACELAGRSCLDQDLPELGEHYLAQSYGLYRSWGVGVKTRALEGEFPQLPGLQRLADTGQGPAEASALSSGKPALESALKALRALCSETDLETLLGRMMSIVMEHAGAESAVLLLKQDRGWVVQGTGDFQTGRYAVLLNLPYDEGTADRKGIPLAASVVNLCLRTEQPVLIGNAIVDARFSADPYIRVHRIKSILCLPLRYRANLTGALYLENRLNTDVFGRVEVEILRLLCTQFSISVQNALLHDALQERLRFEKLVSGLSAAFVNLPSDRVDRRLTVWLKRLATFLGADRAALFRLDADPGALALTHHYTRRGSPKPPGSLLPFEWYLQKIGEGRTMVFRRPEANPAQPDELRRRLFDQGIVSWIGVPLSAGGSSLGMIELTSFHQESGWSPDIIKRLGLIGEILARTLARTIREEQLQRRTRELQEAAEKLKNLSAHLQDVREHERASVAREIHDELGQALTVLRMDAAWVTRHLHDDPSSLREKLKAMIDLIDSSTETVQRIATELRPHILDMLGLFDAVEWLVEEFRKTAGVSCEVHLEGPGVEDEKCAIVLFRIVQEALTNIARHAQARNAAVRLRVEPLGVLLEVEDDGVGIARGQIDSRNSLGLIGMRERVSSLGGSLEIARVGQTGTRLRVTVPHGANP